MIKAPSTITTFLSALYGIYWDRGEIELNKTLADLGLDDEPDPLLDAEKRQDRGRAPIEVAKGEAQHELAPGHEGQQQQDRRRCADAHRRGLS